MKRKTETTCIPEVFAAATWAGESGICNCQSFLPPFWATTAVRESSTCPKSRQRTEPTKPTPKSIPRTEPARRPQGRGWLQKKQLCSEFGSALAASAM